MTRAPVKPARKPAGPVNQSRGAGAPAPASVAATQAQPARTIGFYDPGDVGNVTVEGPPRVEQAQDPTATSPLAGLGDSRSTPEIEHVRAVRAGSVPTPSGATADVTLAPAAQGAEPEETLEQTIARIRKIRRPLGALSQKLALPPIPGYHQHWFNDDGARVEDAKLNGWAHVLDRDGKPVKRAVGSGRDRGVMFAYGMKLPLVFWQEDMAARHEVAEQTIAATKGKLAVARPGEAQTSDKGKFYDPSESGSPVKIEKG